MPIVDTWKGLGWRAACHKLVYKCAQRCLVLDITHLMVLDVCRISPIKNREAAYRSLSYDEVVAFSRDPELGLDRSTTNRLSSGIDFCMGAIVDHQLAGYYWLALDSIEAIHNSAGSEDTGVAISFPENAAFGYKAFVHPKFRGRGLYAELVRAAALWAHQNHRVRFLASTADWTNHAALRSCQRLGKRSLGRVWRFGLPGRMFTVGPRLAADHSILLGRQARVKTRCFGD